MTHAFRIADELHEVWLSRSPRAYVLHLGEARIPVALRDHGEHRQELLLGDESMAVYVATRGDDIHVHLDGEAYTLSYSHSLERFASEGRDSSDAVARAPMPGAVIAVLVQPGQAVSRGDVLVVIESMKMETSIAAAMDGVVHTVHVQMAQTFERDAMLVTLSPVEATP